MPSDVEHSVVAFAGGPREVGIAHGRALHRFGERIERYAAALCATGLFDVARRVATDGIIASCARDLALREFAGPRGIAGTNLATRMRVLVDRWPPKRAPDDLMELLADPILADVSIEGGTLYSNVACPSTGEMWLAAGDIPASSRSPWRRVRWPTA